MILLGWRNQPRVTNVNNLAQRMDTPQISFFYQQNMKEDSFFYQNSLFQEKCNWGQRNFEPPKYDFSMIGCEDNSNAFIEACLLEENEASISKLSGKKNQQTIIQNSGPRTGSERNQPDDGQSTTKVQKNCKNQTKNIPKNFGKAIITFIINNKILVEPYLLSKNIDYDELIQSLKSRRNQFHSINELKNVWLDDKYGSVMRAMSQFFLKKYALQHIFKSKILNRSVHLKYRLKLRKALFNPMDFDHLKFHY